MSNFKRILYACGQIGMMGLTRYLFGWIIDYSSEVDAEGKALFSGALVGAIFLGFRIFDGVTDPVAGMVSDGWVRRGRERRRLLWFSFLLPPIGLTLCFLPDFGMAPWLRWVLLAAGLFIFFLGYTFYAIPYWSLVDDYSGSDEGNRRVLSTALGAGLMVAVGVGFVVSPTLVDSQGFLVGALAFSIPAILLMALPYFAQPQELTQVEVDTGARDESLFRALKIAFGHRRFLAFLVLFSASQMSFTIMTAAAPFIAVQLLDGSRSDVAKLLGPLLGMAVLCFAAVPWISKRFGWERALVAASLLLGVIYCLSGGLGRGIIGTPMITAMVIFGLGGPMTAVLLGLEAEAITACARERGGDVVATYFGVFNFIVKALNGVAMLSAGYLADLSRGDLGPLAVRMMSLIAGGCLFLCVGLYFILRPRRG
jgi:Na+/melibiose symporter-like transporter